MRGHIVVVGGLVSLAQHLVWRQFATASLGVLCHACGEPLGRAPQGVSLARRLASPDLFCFQRALGIAWLSPSSPASFQHRPAWFIVAFEALGFIPQFIFAAGERHRRRGRIIGFGEPSASPNRLGTSGELLASLSRCCTISAPFWRRWACDASEPSGFA